MDIVACKSRVKNVVESMSLMNREIRIDSAVFQRNEVVDHVMMSTSQLNPLTRSFLPFTVVFPFTYPPSVGVRARGDLRMNSVAVFQC